MPDLVNIRIGDRPQTIFWNDIAILLNQEKYTTHLLPCVSNQLRGYQSAKRIGVRYDQERAGYFLQYGVVLGGRQDPQEKAAVGFI